MKVLDPQNMGERTLKMKVMGSHANFYQTNPFFNLHGTPTGFFPVSVLAGCKVGYRYSIRKKKHGPFGGCTDRASTIHSSRS